MEGRGSAGMYAAARGKWSPSSSFAAASTQRPPASAAADTLTRLRRGVPGLEPHWSRVSPLPRVSTPCCNPVWRLQAAGGRHDPPSNDSQQARLRASNAVTAACCCYCRRNMARSVTTGTTTTRCAGGPSPDTACTAWPRAGFLFGRLEGHEPVEDNADARGVPY